jgi:hypothetical protein
MRNWIRPNKLEWLSFLLGMPILCIILNYLLFGDRQFYDPKIWLYSFPVIYLQGLASWYLHIAVMHRLRTRFPDIKQTRQRLLTLAVLHICLTSLTFVTLFYAYDAFSFLGYTLSGAQLINSLLVGVGLNMIATSMWESEYTFNQWKRSHMEMEQLEELSIQQEFDTLKNQVNPHFLF